jgi:hypothetical protein
MASRRSASWAVIPAAGVAAGVGASALLSTVSMALAILAPFGLLAGVLVFAVPHLGLFMLTAGMIAQWPYRLITIAGAGVTASTLLWALASRRRLVPPDRLFALLAALNGLVWLSALYFRGQGSMGVALSYTSFTAFYWAVTTLAVGRYVMRRLAGWMLVSGFAIALIGFVQYLHPFVWIASAQTVEAESAVNAGMDLSLLQWEGFQRIESLTGTPNYLGLTMQILIPFAVLWTWRQRRQLHMLAGVALSGALAAALMLSFTRGAMLTTAAITIPLLAYKLGLRKTVPYLAAGAAVIAVVIGVWEPFRARVFSTISEALSGDPNTAAGWRVAVLPIGLQMFLDHFWTGVGIGQQRTLWEHYAPTTVFTPGTETQLPIHNGYLAAAIDLGILGLTLLTAILGVGWLRVRRLQRHFMLAGQHDMADLACAAEIAWVAMIANIMMYPGLENFRYFWVLLALIGGLSRVAVDKQK